MAGGVGAEAMRHVGKRRPGTRLSRNSHCWERGCKRVGQSPKNFPANKIFLRQIPGLGAEVFHPLKVPPPGTAQPFSD
jgi:hypothetical protein